MIDKRENSVILLSICIPVFNVEQYLQACLDSIISQRTEAIEVVLLDDCSQDRSTEIAEDYVKKFPHVFRYVKHPVNSGLSAARNTLIDEAKGQYIWFLDSDDAILPGALQELMATVSKYHPDMVVCDFKIWRSQEKLKYRLRGELHKTTFDGKANQLIHGNDTILKGLFATGQMHAWSKIIKRSIWAKGPRFPVGKAFEDMATMPRVALLCQSMVYVPQVWVAYRQRPGSIISTMNQRKVLDLSSALSGFKADFAFLDAPAKHRIKEAAGFEISHIAARNMISVMKAVIKPGDTDSQALMKLIKDNFTDQTVYPSGALIRGYLKKMWILRLVRFVFYYRFKN